MRLTRATLDYQISRGGNRDVEPEQELHILLGAAAAKTFSFEDGVGAGTIKNVGWVSKDVKQNQQTDNHTLSSVVPML